MLKPLSDRVVLKAIEKESITKSGIYIPDSANKEKPYMYEVVAIGPGKKESNMDSIKIGDKVLCSQYAGDDVKIDGEEVKIIGIEYVLAIVE
ncbi:MAG: co-chaperone GroES [Candidatus Gracilibacteria bacterium]|nr:co-chaperone GroES [Candidatus Gracilibacteria bacterium]